MGRIDNIKELMANNIFVLDDFISQDRCNEILFAIDESLWVHSKVATRDENKVYMEFQSRMRTSQTIFEYIFPPGLGQLINSVEQEIVTKTKIDSSKMEEWQITKYGYQDKFEFHLDCGCSQDEPQGDRDKTVLLYLMSPIRGGETFFRALNLYVKPVQGRLVVWNNLLPDGNCNHAMMHAGLPVRKGIKIILNTWTKQFSHHKNTTT